MSISLVIITPAIHREAADAALARLGWGNNNYLVELGPDEMGSPTHFGLRTNVAPESLDVLQSEFSVFEGAVLIDATADAARVLHFDTVLNQHGLYRIAPAHID